MIKWNELNYSNCKLSFENSINKKGFLFFIVRNEIIKLGFFLLKNHISLE